MAFGRGEYQPGSIVGDALIAHELAHVEQQRGATAVQPKGSNQDEDIFEREADQSAVEAVAGLYGLGSEGVRTKVSKSGLQLKRCSNGSNTRAAGGWTAAELKAMLDRCDGELGIWELAKAANGGSDPTISLGNGGQVNLSSGVITLDQSRDKCFAVQQLIQELSNLSRKTDF